MIGLSGFAAGAGGRVHQAPGGEPASST